MFACLIFLVICFFLTLLEETEKGSILLATQHGIIRQIFLPNLRLRGVTTDTELAVNGEHDMLPHEFIHS